MNQQEAFNELERLQRLQKCSEGTIYNYKRILLQFFEVINKENAEEINEDDIIKFFNHIQNKTENKKANSINTIRFIIKAFIKKVLRNQQLYTNFNFIVPSIPNNKEEEEALTIEEIKQIFDIINNERNKTMLHLIYSSGLRRAEISKLKWEHINFSEEGKIISPIFTIKEAKGRGGGKTRTGKLSKIVIEELEKFYKNKNSEYIFPSCSNKKKGITGVTINNIFKNYSKKAGIKKNVHVHLLRVSYATHLSNKEVDISIIQQAMGHSNINTTLGYIRNKKEKIKKIPDLLE